MKKLLFVTGLIASLSSPVFAAQGMTLQKVSDQMSLCNAYYLSLFDVLKSKKDAEADRMADEILDLAKVNHQANIAFVKEHHLYDVAENNKNARKALMIQMGGSYDNAHSIVKTYGDFCANLTKLIKLDSD